MLLGYKTFPVVGEALIASIMGVLIKATMTQYCLSRQNSVLQRRVVICVISMLSPFPVSVMAYVVRASQQLN